MRAWMLVTLLMTLMTLSVALGCGTSSGSSAAPDASSAPVDAGGPEAAATSCFTNPKTFLEIINASTDAQAVDKTDDLSPMNLPDGGLQPLP